MPAMELHHQQAPEYQPPSDISIEMATEAALGAQVNNLLTTGFKPEVIDAAREGVVDNRRVAAYHATPVCGEVEVSAIYGKVAAGEEIDDFLRREYGDDVEVMTDLHAAATRYGERSVERLKPGQEMVACAALIMAAQGADGANRRSLIDAFMGRAQRYSRR